MVNVDDAVSQLEKVCEYAGITPARVRSQLTFMQQLKPTQQALEMFHDSNEEAWPHAAMTVLDCLTSGEVEKYMSRENASFLRACLGLDGRSGGWVERVRAVLAVEGDHVLSARALSTRRRERLAVFAVQIIRLNSYPCLAQSSGVPSMDKVADLVTSIFLNAAVNATTRDNVRIPLLKIIEQIELHLPRAVQAIHAKYASQSGYSAEAVRKNLPALVLEAISEWGYDEIVRSPSGLNPRYLASYEVIRIILDRQRQPSGDRERRAFLKGPLFRNSVALIGRIAAYFEVNDAWRLAFRRPPISAFELMATFHEIVTGSARSIEQTENKSIDIDSQL